MFDALLDVPQVALALSIVGLSLLGVVTQLPSAPAPDATAAASTVDAAASSPHSTVAVHPLMATAIRIGRNRIALRNEGGTARAAFAYGPVTPVPESGPLRRVLRGVAPSAVFDSPGAMRRAARSVAGRSAAWRDAGDRLLVRHVAWGDVDVTLVGA